MYKSRPATCSAASRSTPPPPQISLYLQMNMGKNNMVKPFHVNNRDTLCIPTTGCSDSCLCLVLQSVLLVLIGYHGRQVERWHIPAWIWRISHELASDLLGKFCLGRGGWNLKPIPADLLEFQLICWNSICSAFLETLLPPKHAKMQQMGRWWSEAELISLLFSPLLAVSLGFREREIN